jgi:hypothetical protein
MGTILKRFGKECLYQNGHSLMLNHQTMPEAHVTSLVLPSEQKRFVAKGKPDLAKLR